MALPWAKGCQSFGLKKATISQGVARALPWAKGCQSFGLKKETISHGVALG